MRGRGGFLPCTAAALRGQRPGLVRDFANALDNAIQACAGMEGTTSIRMAGEQQGSFYLLEFENTCLPKASPAMGTGLSNIKTVAEKYGGAMTFETSGALFRLHVLLDISVRPDGISGQMP